MLCVDSVTDDEAHLRLDAEDDEYMYDDDIIMEEQSDEMDDTDDDKDGHFPESDKVYQTVSDPLISMNRYSSDEEEEEESHKDSKAVPTEARLCSATGTAAVKNKPVVWSFPGFDCTQWGSFGVFVFLSLAAAKYTCLYLEWSQGLSFVLSVGNKQKRLWLCGLLAT